MFDSTNGFIVFRFIRSLKNKISYLFKERRKRTIQFILGFILFIAVNLLIWHIMKYIYAFLLVVFSVYIIIDSMCGV